MLRHQLKVPLLTPIPATQPLEQTRAVKRLIALARVLNAQANGLSQASASRAEKLPTSTLWRYRKMFQEGGLAALEGLPMGRPRTRQRKPARTHAVYELRLARIK